MCSLKITFTYLFIKKIKVGHTIFNVNSGAMLIFFLKSQQFYIIISLLHMWIGLTI